MQAIIRKWKSDGSTNIMPYRVGLMNIYEKDIYRDMETIEKRLANGQLVQTDHAEFYLPEKKQD